MKQKRRKIVDYLPASIVTPEENQEGVSLKNNRKKSIFVHIYPLFFGIFFGIILPVAIHFTKYGFSSGSIFLAFLYLFYVLIFLNSILLRNFIGLFKHSCIQSGK